MVEDLMIERFPPVYRRLQLGTGSILVLRGTQVGGIARRARVARTRWYRVGGRGLAL